MLLSENFFPLKLFLERGGDFDFRVWSADTTCKVTTSCDFVLGVSLIIWNLFVIVSFVCYSFLIGRTIDYLVACPVLQCIFGFW